MSLRKYRIHEGLWAAFYSPDFYRSVVYRWKGAGLLYLLLVVAVSSLIISGIVTAQLLEFRGHLPAITAQLPVIHIADGVLTTEPEGRHEILEPETGQPLVIIDTGTDQPPATTAERDGAVIFAARRQLMVTSPEGDQQVQSFAKFGKLSLSPRQMEQLLNFVIFAVLILTPLFLLVFLYFIRVIQMFAFALLTWIFSGVMGRKLDYFERLRLTAAALTPALLFGSVIGPGINFPNSEIAWFAVAVLYIAFAISVVRPPTPPPVPEREQNPWAKPPQDDE